MAEIDYELIKAINSGHCFLLVGSGLSSDSGLPSWKQLATDAYMISRASMPPAQRENMERRIDAGQFPKVFGDCEKASPSKEEFYRIIGMKFSEYKASGSYLYSMIAKWPIPAYLTTNYDNILYDSLIANGSTFVIRRNSRDDFATLSATSQDTIFKIHGDFSVPKDIVLTDRQYAEFSSDPVRDYWRRTIASAINMVPLLLIGYSAKDPDFSEQLERIKIEVSPIRPVYMFAADIPDHQVVEYRSKYNIKIYTYSTRGGSHGELRKLIRVYDSFIRRRNDSYIPLPRHEENDNAELASAMYIYTSLRLSGQFEDAYIRALQYLILDELRSHQSISEDCLGECVRRRLSANRPIDVISIEKAKEILFDRGHITIKDGVCCISDSGLSICHSTNGSRILVQEKFDTWCKIKVGIEYPEILDTSEICAVLRVGLMEAFKTRGIELAKASANEESVDVAGATDIIKIINEMQSALRSDDERKAFMLLILEVFESTDPVVRDYIAIISQGYFAFHILGLDSACNDKRLEMLVRHPWVIDSSVILPAIAKYCSNHEYAESLINEMRSLGISLYTTHRLLKETVEHANWVVKYFSGKSIDDLVLVQAMMAGPGFKKNLFLDGYAVWANRQGVQSLDEYMQYCLGAEYEHNLSYSVERRLSEIGIKLTDFQDWQNFTPDIWESCAGWKMRIENYRVAHDTFRTEAQCEAEAEIKAITSKYEVAFLSQSLVLDRINKYEEGAHRVTWTPESVFRLLSMFSKKDMKSDLYFQSFLQEFFYQGLEMINRSELTKLLLPIIRQSKISLEKELQNYERMISPEALVEIRHGFDGVDDLEKPFYTFQVASKLANRAKSEAEYYRKKADDLEIENKNLKSKSVVRFKPKKKKKKKGKGTR